MTEASSLELPKIEGLTGWAFLAAFWARRAKLHPDPEERVISDHELGIAQEWERIEHEARGDLELQVPELQRKLPAAHGAQEIARQRAQGPEGSSPQPLT